MTCRRRTVFAVIPSSHSCSVAQSCPALCDPMDCSTPGFPAQHQLLELSNSCLSSWWWYPNISSSVVPFSSCLQSFGGILGGDFLREADLNKGAHISITATSVLLKYQVSGSLRLPDSPLGKECSQFSSMGWPTLRLKILQQTPDIWEWWKKSYLSQGLYILVINMNDAFQIPWTIPGGDLYFLQEVNSKFTSDLKTVREKTTSTHTPHTLHIGSPVSKLWWRWKTL